MIGSYKTKWQLVVTKKSTLGTYTYRQDELHQYQHAKDAIDDLIASNDKDIVSIELIKIKRKTAQFYAMIGLS